MNLRGINPFTKKYYGYVPRTRFHKKASRKNKVAVKTIEEPETMFK